MDLPETVTEYDKDVFLSTLIRRYATLPIMYNDPDWFYEECEFWFKQHKFAFTKMWEAMEIEYKPLENYNKHQKDTTTPGVTDTETHSESDTVEHTGTDTTTPFGTTKVEHKGYDELEKLGETINDTNTFQTSTEVVENKVSAFNESNYQNSSKTETSRDYAEGVPDNVHNVMSHKDDREKQNYSSGIETSYVDAKTELEHGETITTNYGHTITNSHEGFDTFESDIYGNIGVTTSQQMLESEILLRHKIDMYKVMAIDFASEMLVRVF